MQAKMNRIAFWIEETKPFIIKKMFINKLGESGFGILKQTEHYFEPQGYTGLWLLSESHFAVHTFPEENKTYVELSSCVDEPFYVFLNKIKDVEKEVINNG